MFSVKKMTSHRKRKSYKIFGNDASLHKIFINYLINVRCVGRYEFAFTHSLLILLSQFYCFLSSRQRKFAILKRFKRFIFSKIISFLFAQKLNFIHKKGDTNAETFF